MLQFFIRCRRKRLYISFLLTLIIALWALHSLLISVSFRLFNAEYMSLLGERACVMHAKESTHNFTIMNSWKTNYLNLFGYTEDRKTKYWNGYDGFRKFDFTGVQTCSIIYSGDNIDGTDGIRFAREYPFCYIWFLESIPTFYKRFVDSSDWKFLMTSNRSKLYNVYPYSLSHHSTFIDMMENNSSKRQNFSLIREQQSNNSHQHHKLIVRDISEIMFEFKILRQLDRKLNIVDGVLTLLHIDCEGCEYEVLERLIDTDLIKHVRYLQFRTYRPKSIQSTITERYCSLQQRLKNTHRKEFGGSLVWERWSLLSLGTLVFVL